MSGVWKCMALPYSYKGVGKVLASSKCLLGLAKSLPNACEGYGFYVNYGYSALWCGKMPVFAI